MKLSGEFLKNGLFILAFLAVSFAIAKFRGSDHGQAPSWSGYQLVNGASAANIADNKSAVVYFWATWCGVCKTNLPLVKWYASLLEDSQNIVFFSVEEGENPAELQQYLKDNNVTFPVVVGNGNTMEDWKVSGYPTFIFVDESGLVRYADSGIVNPVSFALRLLFLRFF